MAGRPPKKFSKKKESLPPADEKVRLNRFIANAGVCSRREADNLISKGLIKVNGKIVTELGVKVAPQDVVEYKGKKLMGEKLQYVLLNKPKDFISTSKDPQGRKTVMSLVSKACKERIYPVGRLDRDTTGLLLFTNDGELAKKLTHPSHKFKKIYQVELNNPLTKDDFQRLVEGVELEDGLAAVDEAGLLSDRGDLVGLEIHMGRNRIVRRIFEHLGYEVTKLDRVMFGSLTKKDLPRGKWRHLTPREIGILKKS